MRYYGNEPYIPGTMDDYKPIQHGANRPVEVAYVPHGKKVRCVKDGKLYPSIQAAARAAGVHRTTMDGYLKDGRKWVFA